MVVGCCWVQSLTTHSICEGGLDYRSTGRFNSLLLANVSFFAVVVELSIRLPSLALDLLRDSFTVPSLNDVVGGRK